MISFSTDHTSVQMFKFKTRVGFFFESERFNALFLFNTVYTVCNCGERICSVKWEINRKEIEPNTFNCENGGIREEMLIHSNLDLRRSIFSPLFEWFQMLCQTKFQIKFKKNGNISGWSLKWRRNREKKVARKRCEQKVLDALNWNLVYNLRVFCCIFLCCFRVS